ncbi:DNA replication licensing factor MCM8 [Melipona quadrifasciata]|uniref:Minichromosome maintenance 8 n=1 Tax=Melipona quadrifasciata TaxID=166423 RepID=A0A0N0BFG0_9HYME|nr:DNA replication licensing factor MCM8 [Melipona quadrifasciata]
MRETITIEADKNNQCNEKIRQPLDPIETYNLLNVHNNYINFNIPYYGWKLFFDDEDIYENPLHTLNCFKLAVHQQILNSVPQENLSSINIITTLSTVRIKILNYEPIISLQDLKANSYGRLVSIRGCVIRVGHIKHLAQWIVFACRKCNLQKIMKQSLGVYTIPKKCDICGTSKFRAMLDSPLVKSIFFQTIKIQEHSNNDQECDDLTDFNDLEIHILHLTTADLHYCFFVIIAKNFSAIFGNISSPEIFENNKGSLPRMIDIELMDNLVNTCMPGDDITLTGIIKPRNKISFSLYMEAITIVNNKQRLQNKNIINSELTIKDYLAIKEVYNTPNIFSLLVHSLCPSIYGHEIIKAGLILSLFGGTVECSESRENIHILIVGDPGLGKSQMLQACARIAAKGVYVCGNSSTSSGLTITLAKENKCNNFSLEPGALVLTDRGCCCIDEFDKMYKQHAVLLEAMEQQSISIAKSGIICSLPTRASILAAANPINGRFNRSKTVMQNLKMSIPLLSRFDLTFLLLDEPNKHIDDLLCKHVMSVHADLNATNSIQSSMSQHINIPHTDKLSLRDRLTSSITENMNIIPQTILRKYISYARQYVKPKLTKEAAIILQNYYLELRKRNNKFSGLSICNRQLEAMIRLTEARAKLDLRTETTEKDALDVIEILQYTFEDKITNCQSLSTKNVTNGRVIICIFYLKVKEFIKILKKETVSNSNKIFSMKRLNEIALANKFLMSNFSEFIAKLNENGILLKMDSNTFKFIP